MNAGMYFMKSSEMTIFKCDFILLIVDRGLTSPTLLPFCLHHD
jgi:hypothetical protein